MKEYLDIPYKQINNLTLHLDIFLPDNTPNPPLIMWIHGGAWLAGDRKTPFLMWQLERGYALASIDYRLIDQGIFPCNIIDCKDALVFLKANAEKYGYDPTRIVVGGDSAGGHLAALMGTTIGHSDWEQTGADCSVKAVVDFYGPTAVTKEWENAQTPESPESLLIGEFVKTKRGKEKAAAANPIIYIDGSEPPFLIIHGDKDDVVPYSQSLFLRNALEDAGVSVAMHRVHGGGHGFEGAEINAVIDAFLDYHI